MNKHNPGSGVTSTVNRRTLLQGAVALGGTAALGGIAMPNVVRAAASTLKIGVIDSLSGVRSQFAEPTPWILDTVRALTKSGLQIGSKTYDVEILLRDNQSSLNGTAPVANQLLLQEKVDLLLMPDSDAGISASGLCDAMGIPGISTMTPWQANFFTRGGNPAKGFPFSFHFFWGADDLVKNYVGLWKTLDANAVGRDVGTLYFDNAAGKAFASPETGMPAGIKAAGFNELNAGFFKPETSDFTAQIAQFKKAGTRIQSGFMFIPQWQTLWSQAVQGGYKPEVCTVAGPFLFPSAINVLGEHGDGMSTEVWWTPTFPFHSSLTGQSARELADSYTAATGRQWTQPIGYTHALWEVAIAALKAAGDPRDRKAVAEAIRTMQLDSVVGRIDFKNGPVKGVAATPMAMGQWRLIKGSKYPADLQIVYNGTAPMIPVQSNLKLLSKL